MLFRIGLCSMMSNPASNELWLFQQLLAKKRSSTWSLVNLWLVLTAIFWSEPFYPYIAGYILTWFPSHVLNPYWKYYSVRLYCIVKSKIMHHLQDFWKRWLFQFFASIMIRRISRIVRVETSNFHSFVAPVPTHNVIPLLSFF